MLVATLMRHLIWSASYEPNNFRVPFLRCLGCDNIHFKFLQSFQSCQVQAFSIQTTYPHYSISTLHDGCSSSRNDHRLCEAGWRYPESGRQRAPEAVWRRSLLQIRNHFFVSTAAQSLTFPGLCWRSLLLSHPWWTHSCRTCKRSLLSSPRTLL